MEKAHKALLEWFFKNGRHHLPWRQSSNSYHIYLSEIMLQQTQVERVLIYYQRFLRHFPTLQSLALANIDEVLALWSGLGYYKRARNLHATAKLCPQGLPKDYKELRTLPGIGEYTASAICSFAYNQPIAVVDTNIDRLLRRLFATDRPKRSAQAFLNTALPKEHNLALMDLGSLLCTPTNPKCPSCPLEAFCQGKNDPLSFTKKRSQKRQKIELHLAFWIEDEAIALIRSQSKLYYGLYTLPKVLPNLPAMASFSHSYTKYSIKVYLYNQKPKEYELIPLAKIASVPINSLVKKALEIGGFL